MAINDQDFKNALKLWASGVAVVTTKTKEFGPQGMTVTSFTSVSLTPHQILVCIHQHAETEKGIATGKCFAVNILNVEQEKVSNQFSGGCHQTQRFESILWHEGVTSSPIFNESLVSIECSVAKKILSGSHWVIIGDVQQVNYRKGEPLLYYNSAYRGLV
jgi:flavin reductase (DIM6/NTAB) family NADH-FMN oxidoreductase RutF